jgi:hypothetical protein
MIGGEDIVVETSDRPRSAVLDAVVCCIRRCWPRAVVVDGITGTRFDSYGAVPFGLLSELLVYRDEPSFDAWQQLGADSGNANTMIHLIADDAALTLVVDDPDDATMASIVDEARDMLAPSNFWAMAA